MERKDSIFNHYYNFGTPCYIVEDQTTGVMYLIVYADEFTGNDVYDEEGNHVYETRCVTNKHKIHHGEHGDYVWIHGKTYYFEGDEMFVLSHFNKFHSIMSEKEYQAAMIRRIERWCEMGRPPFETVDWNAET